MEWYGTIGIERIGLTQLNQMVNSLLLVKLWKYIKGICVEKTTPLRPPPLYFVCSFPLFPSDCASVQQWYHSRMCVKALAFISARRGVWKGIMVTWRDSTMSMEWSVVLREILPKWMHQFQTDQMLKFVIWPYMYIKGHKHLYIIDQQYSTCLVQSVFFSHPPKKK